MKQIKIDLTTFLNLGGSLDKFPLEFARYIDVSEFKEIDEIDHIDPVGNSFCVFFADGTSKICGGHLIFSFVEFVLDQKYL